MSVEYTAINKDTASGEIKNFLESFPEGTVFKMVINSKRGYLRVKTKNASKGRWKKLFGKLRIQMSKA